MNEARRPITGKSGHQAGAIVGISSFTSFTRKPPAFADSLGWESWDHALRRLGPDTYLMTYVLRQEDRLTRRATIWQRALDRWRILYHQGTVVSVQEDDVAPS